MKRPGLFNIFAVVAAAAAVAVAQPASARTLDLAFMPPAVEPQDICTNDAAGDPADDLAAVVGDGALTDALRLQFLLHDIRALQSTDPDRWFDFILTLIDWRAKLDATFTEADVTLARIDLYVDAGRLDQLRADGLIDTLRNSSLKLDNAQKMRLSDYYRYGIGVSQDVAFANSLTRDAAYGGNPEALLTLVRMDLEGTPIDDWDAPLDLTMTLALGGMLGQMNPAICERAGRIAQRYLDGDILTRNPDIAYAWFKFAADLGGAKAAWRIVELHLSAEAGQKDNAEMLRYLDLAVRRGITVDANQATRIEDAGNLDDGALQKILGFNFSAEVGGGRPSVAPYFRLAVKLDANEVSPDSPYLAYLREVIQFDTAPGFVFTKLAKEVLGRKGEWAGEAEAMALLEQAATRLDGEGMQLLARKLVRYRDDPASIGRSANLLMDVVARFGVASAMNDLNTLYRCQSNQAPHLPEATLWAENYRATQEDVVDLSPADLVSLDPFKQPETLAQVQSQALAGAPISLANFLERVQMDPLATQDAHRLWADRADGSDKALENFGKLEFALTANPGERDLAIELMRRIFLNNGVTTALDLAVILTDDLSRSPEIATEILELLTKAGNRGEGASIRLKSQLLARTTTPQAIYDEFSSVIDARGDFLALMFAIPFVDKDKAEDYIDRAVSLMNCTTKDTDELGEAYATLALPDMTFHWRQIGMTFENGNVLGKLGLTDRQIAAFGTGNAPTERDVLQRNLDEGDLSARRALFALTADPDLQTFDPAAAAGHLVALLRDGTAQDEDWVLNHYRTSDPAVRTLVEQRIDMRDLFQKAAQRGDVNAKLEFALLLRDQAKSIANLQSSARWLKEASEGGNIVAMAEYGYALAFGIGVPQDRVGALGWLDQADRAGNLQARSLARLLRVGAPQ